MSRQKVVSECACVTAPVHLCVHPYPHRIRGHMHVHVRLCARAVVRCCVFARIFACRRCDFGDSSRESRREGWREGGGRDGGTAGQLKQEGVCTQERTRVYESTVRKGGIGLRLCRHMGNRRPAEIRTPDLPAGSPPAAGPAVDTDFVEGLATRTGGRLWPPILHKRAGPGHESPGISARRCRSSCYQELNARVI